MNTNILAITIGVAFFIFLLSFIIYSVVNIRKSKKLKDLYKKMLWVGVGIMFCNALSSVISNDAHSFTTLVFINYIKFIYFSVVALGFFFIARNVYNKLKNLIIKIKVRSV